MKYITYTLKINRTRVIKIKMAIKAFMMVYILKRLEIFKEPLKLWNSYFHFLISFNFCSRHSWPLLWYSIFIMLLKTTDSKHRHVSEWLLYVMTALHCVLPFSFSEKNLLFIFLLFRISHFSGFSFMKRCNYLLFHLKAGIISYT